MSDKRRNFAPPGENAHFLDIHCPRLLLLLLLERMDDGEQTAEWALGNQAQVSSSPKFIGLDQSIYI